jgi:hypothetical protein
MKLSTSLVAVKKITSQVDRSTFASADLDHAARLILNIEGVINPLILQRISLDAYEVVDGDFEYYAAARAREIDPLKGEFVSAFIINSDNEGTLKSQVKMLRKQSAPTETEPVATTPFLPQQENFAEYMSQIEGSIQHLENSLQIKIEQSLQARFAELYGRFDRLEEGLKKPQKIPATKGKSYQRMTVAELKELAKQREIELPAKLKKAEIIALLETVDAS